MQWPCQVVLTDKGREQARAAGRQIHTMIKQAHGNSNHKLFIMTSPYTRTLQTTDHILEAFTDEEVRGGHERCCCLVDLASGHHHSTRPLNVQFLQA